jgi:hypothetical protein
LSGLVGSIVGSGVGATVGGLGSTIYYLLSEGGSYLLNGGGVDVILKAYETGVRGAGQWALIGGLGGMFLFAKIRDYVLGKG